MKEFSANNGKVTCQDIITLGDLKEVLNYARQFWTFMFNTTQLSYTGLYSAAQTIPSRLANGGDIYLWRLVPPVGHCNTLYLGS